MDTQEVATAQRQYSERNAKMNMGDTYQNGAMGDTCTNMSGLCEESQLRRRTQREEAQYRLENASSEAQRAARAVSFFVEHPEFDEFIQLVRAGAIQI